MTSLGLILAEVSRGDESTIDSEALHARRIEDQKSQILEYRESDLSQIRTVGRHDGQRNTFGDNAEEFRVRQNVDAAVADLTRLEKRCAPEIAHHARFQQLALC